MSSRTSLPAPGPSRSAQAAALLVITAAAGVISWFKIYDMDLFWHLKAGLVALEQHRLALDRNVFSNLYPDNPWMNPYWLFQRFVALLYRWHGWEAISGAKIVAVVCLGQLLFLSVRHRVGARPEAVGLTVIALAVVQFRLTERPHLASYLFFACLVLVLERARTGNLRPLALLPALFALWSNVHPELIMGLLLLVAATAGAVAQRWRGEGADSGERAGVLLITGASCAAATLLNPFGHQVLGYPFLTLSVANVVTITEYAASDPRVVTAFWAYLLLVAGAVAWAARARDLAGLVRAAIFLGPALLYVRLIPYFVIATLPLVVEAAVKTRDAAGRRAGSAWRVALPVVTAVFFVWALAFDRSLPYRWGTGLDDERVPEAAVRVVLANKLPENLYNTFVDGGYLLFRLYPAMRVFLDARGVPAYPLSFVAGLDAGGGGSDGLQELLASSRVRTALVDIRSLSALGFTPSRWGMVFWDDRWCVLLLRHPDSDGLLRRLEYRLFLPGAGAIDTRGSTERELLIAEMERNQRERLHPSPLLAGEIEQARAGRRR